MSYSLVMFMIMNSFLFSKNCFYKIYTLLLVFIFYMFLVSFMFKSSWFSLIFLVLMTSGLLVMFLYFSSLEMNQNLIKDEVEFYLQLIYMLGLVIWFKMIKINFFNVDLNFNGANLNNFLNFNEGFLYIMLIMYMFIILILSLDLVTSLKNSFRFF